MQSKADNNKNRLERSEEFLRGFVDNGFETISTEAVTIEYESPRSPQSAPIPNRTEASGATPSRGTIPRRPPIQSPVNSTFTPTPKPEQPKQETDVNASEEEQSKGAFPNFLGRFRKNEAKEEETKPKLSKKKPQTTFSENQHHLHIGFYYLVIAILRKVSKFSLELNALLLNLHLWIAVAIIGGFILFYAENVNWLKRLRKPFLYSLIAYGLGVILHF
ncbi:hypothetical protein OsccyDRAFT_0562 [Leptolyngbyaceae cyanobacterium JSC-12]|nr:hypothetical protein OsccyDRAFT_0562 [Leptolyngbyaceae cyanobacterium JSC-12]